MHQVGELPRIIKLLFESRLQLLYTRLKFCIFLVKVSAVIVMLLCSGFNLLLVGSWVLYTASCYFGDVLTPVQNMWIFGGQSSQDSM